MKRYRIIAGDFDSRAGQLLMDIRDEWEERVKDQHRRNRENIIHALKSEFGELHFEIKINNFKELGPKPFSIIAFHNEFFAQVRSSFVMGCYYPALTGACALGERILNHLILALRNEFRSTEQYKRVHRKNSFDDWSLAIDILAEWEVLLPAAEEAFRELERKRNEAIHFRPETDQDVRQLALDAIGCLQRIIVAQFSGFGTQPWFITGIPGEIYIKKDWEAKPFVRAVYLRNGLLVGPYHRILSLFPLRAHDPDSEQPLPDVSDAEFEKIRREFNESGQKN